MDNKVSFEVELKTDDKGVIHATASMNNLEDAIREVKNGMKSYAEDVGKYAIDMDALSNMVGMLNAAIKSLTSSYAAQETTEAKLAQVMRNTMGASDAEFQSIKGLTSAQQQLGVIGDEVQLAGAILSGDMKKASEILMLFICYTFNVKASDPGGTRTHDPQLRRLLLYPAELLDHPQ